MFIVKADCTPDHLAASWLIVSNVHKFCTMYGNWLFANQLQQRPSCLLYSKLPQGHSGHLECHLPPFLSQLLGFYLFPSYHSQHQTLNFSVFAGPSSMENANMGCVFILCHCVDLLLILVHGGHSLLSAECTQ